MINRKKIPQVPDIFRCYEQQRGIYPDCQFPDRTKALRSLMDIESEIDAFVFDAFGVLNIGNKPIPGAGKRISELRIAGKEIRVLSNGASLQPQQVLRSFERMGMYFSSNEIITSRSVAVRSLDKCHWGVFTTLADDLSDIRATTTRLDEEISAYDEVERFLILSSNEWKVSLSALLLTTLKSNPRPVIIANPDLVAPRDTGFSIEPGTYGQFVSELTPALVRYFGKPFPDVFEAVEESLGGIPNDRIAMCGDTLHTDILGGAARGWKTVAVTQDGLFSGHDINDYIAASGIRPNWLTGRI